MVQHDKVIVSRVCVGFHSPGTLDRSVGRLLAVLKDENIDNETLVVFSADNGGSLHWHELGGVNGAFRCGKGTTWEGMLA